MNHFGRRVTVASLAALVASGSFGAAIAAANPQPGLSSPPSGGAQPGLVSPDPAPAPAPAPQRQVWVEVPQQQQRYENVQWRQYDAPAQPAPAPVQNTAPVQNPVPVPAVPAPVEDSAPVVETAPQSGVIAPIAAPEGRLRIGDFITDRPDWMSDEDLEKTNNQSALIEADIANAWVDAGLGDVDRADRVAAATMAGGATGALVAGGAGALVGGAAGAAIGTPIGAAGGSVFVPGVGTVAGGTAGAVTGGAISAAAVGIPAAIAGGAAGAFAGAAFGAGDTLPDEEARELFPEPEPLVIPGAENVPGLEAFAPKPGDTAAAEQPVQPEPMVEAAAQPAAVEPAAPEPVFTDVLPEPPVVAEAPADVVGEFVNVFLQG